MVAAAIIGGTVGGALIGGVASNSAAGKQADAADRAGQISQEQYEQTRSDQLAQLAQQRADSQPYRNAGYGALSQLVTGTAPGGSLVKPFSMEDYTEDPGYKFRLSQGQKSITAAASAAGSQYSGATLKALNRFNSNQASQEYGAAYSRYQTDQGNEFNRLSSLAGTGQTSVAQAGQASTNAYGTIANSGTSSAAAQGSAVQNAAAATASGYVGTANAINGSIGTLANQYQLSQLTGTGATVPYGAAAGYYSQPAGAVSNILY